jgi:general secretion pathway protein J
VACRSASGYTLVEVLVAVLVFAVLAASAYGALNALSRAAVAHRDHATELAGLQLTMTRLAADLRQLSHRSVRDGFGQVGPALTGSATALQGTRAGWSNPNELRRSQLQRFAWQFDGRELLRLAWPVTDPAPAALPVPEAIDLAVRDLRLAYRDAQGAWYDQWPPRRASDQALPSAIELRIDTVRFGALRRLLVLD